MEHYHLLMYHQILQYISLPKKIKLINLIIYKMSSRSSSRTISFKSPETSKRVQSTEVSKRNAFSKRPQTNESTIDIENKISEYTKRSHEIKLVQNLEESRIRKEREQLRNIELEKIPIVKIEATSLRLISRKELQGDTIAVCEITKTDLNIEKMEIINLESTLYDPAMGPYTLSDECRTCGLQGSQCPGHFGKILFVRPKHKYSKTEENRFYDNPIYVHHLRVIANVLTCICSSCGHLKIPPEKAKVFMVGSGMRRLKNYSLASESVLECPHGGTVCKSQPPYTIEKNRIVRKISKDKKVIVYPIEAYNIMNSLNKEEYQALGFTAQPADQLIFFGQLVSPPLTRPPRKIDGKIKDDSFTKLYVTVVAENEAIKSSKIPEHLKNKADNNPEVIKYWFDQSSRLIEAVTALVNSSSEGGKPVGLKSAICSKEGNFRKLVAGANVDASARALLGPGILLRPDELGVPEVIANTLTIPITASIFTDYLGNVTSNIEELQNLLLNGKVPQIEREGQKIFVKKGEEEKIQIRPKDIVFRNLKNGDLILANRNPTLHKQSVMAHRVKVVKDLQFKVPLETTFAYNADFDGDEGNIHVIQTVNASGDLQNMLVENSLFSEKTGSVIIAPAFNAPIGIMLLTRPEIVLDKNLFYDAIRYFIDINLKVDFPTFEVFRENFDSEEEFLNAEKDTYFYKIEQLGLNRYSGRALMSLFLPESLNYRINLKKPQKFFINYETIYKKGNQKFIVKNDTKIPLINKEAIEIESLGNDLYNAIISSVETTFEVRNGVLISGTMNKAMIGVGSSFLGYIYRQFGGKFGITFISYLTTLSNWYLEQSGFTTAPSDYFTLEELDDLRNHEKIRDKLDAKIANAFLQVRSMEGHSKNEIEERKRIQNIINTLNIIEIEGISLSTGPESGYLGSNLHLAIESGSKGSEATVSLSRMVSGLQLVGGQLPKATFGNRTSIFFTEKSNSPLQLGFCPSPLSTGLTPSEQLFTAQNVRNDMILMKRGVPDSGYIQRKFVELMGDLIVNYQHGITKGFGENAPIIQIFYGDLGFETTNLIPFTDSKGTFLTPFEMDKIIQNL